MRKALIVVDMQNDFITGSLANKSAQKMLYKMADYITDFDGDVFFTLDTHYEDYLDTQEGKKLPVIHCIKDSVGWGLHPIIQKAIAKKRKENKYGVERVIKNSFGSIMLGTRLADERIMESPYTDIEICGVCTDICVISNAMIIKAFLPEANVKVLRDLCAGVTLKSHENALKAMECCQIDIVESEQ